MMTMSELLEDKAFRSFMLTPPKTPEVARAKHLSPMWVVYVQKTAQGKWRRKAFRKYRKALEFMNRAIQLGYHDAAISNKRIGFDPPTRIVRVKGKYKVGTDGVKRQVTKIVQWKPKIPIGEDDEHNWCRACRRPTVWRHYSKHPALHQFPVLDYSVRRCCICGGSERINMNQDERRISH